MEIAKNTLFEWTMNFVGREKTPVCITMEVSWVRAWDFGNTTLFRLERYDAKTGELLGAHMLGAEVTELIQGYVIGMSLETTEVELMEAVFPHPTLSEMMHEAVLDSYGKAIHV